MSLTCHFVMSLTCRTITVPQACEDIRQLYCSLTCNLKNGCLLQLLWVGKCSYIVSTLMNPGGVQHPGYKILGTKSWVQNPGCKIWGTKPSWVQNPGTKSRIQNPGYKLLRGTKSRVQNLGCKPWVQNLGYKILGTRHAIHQHGFLSHQFNIIRKT